MSKKNEIVKVPFYGNEIIVIEKNGKRLVPMKPIVEALGLAWRDQQKMIANDPVLSSTRCVTHLVAEDGKQREMICLPLEFLNGWLFKVSASRYKGKKREAIIKYQRKCYLALHEYFFHGAAINPSINIEQINAVMKKLQSEINQKNDLILVLKQENQNRQDIIDTVTSDVVYGDISPETGRKKVILVRQHFRSYGEPKAKKSRSRMQMVFDFFKGGK
jgi:hypothetical protein